MASRQQGFTPYQQAGMHQGMQQQMQPILQQPPMQQTGTPQQIRQQTPMPQQGTPPNVTLGMLQHAMQTYGMQPHGTQGIFLYFHIL